MAIIGKPGRCTRTTQKRWPVVACVTTPAVRQFYLPAELLQARHFGGDVMGLDVEVNATFVIHLLDLHDGFVGRGFQHAIGAASARMIVVH